MIPPPTRCISPLYRHGSVADTESTGIERRRGGQRSRAAVPATVGFVADAVGGVAVDSLCGEFQCGKHEAPRFAVKARVAATLLPAQSLCDSTPGKALRRASRQFTHTKEN